VVTPSVVGGFCHLTATAWAALTPVELALVAAELLDAGLPELEHALRITMSTTQEKTATILGRVITPVRTGLVIVVPACG
jgi:hypothetical protein